jgi:hypothetical protein
MNPKKACAGWTSDDPLVGQAVKVCVGDPAITDRIVA